jgi:hypothetical protein
MPHVWVKSAPSACRIIALEKQEIPLDELRERLNPDLPLDGIRPIRGVLLRGSTRDEPWMLLASPWSGVRVNGLRLVTGLRRLRDRDHIRLPGTDPLFFSTAVIAAVEPAPDLGRELPCARCRAPIEPATPALRCPACAIWHHQTHDRQCWTYAPRCASCPHPTHADGEFHWTPEDL